VCHAHTVKLCPVLVLIMSCLSAFLSSGNQHQQADVPTM